MDVREAARRLAAAGCIAADLEAAELAAAAAVGPVAGRGVEAAATDDGTEVPDRWVERRERGEPLAWIVGRTTFCGRTVRVDRGVYVPRPQTEELARRAAALLPAQGWALDLCTGAGAIAVHLAVARPGATVIGVDRDERAAHCAAGNGVRTLVADLAVPLHASGRFDVITAVPPYVPSGAVHLLPTDVRDHEPLTALDGGTDGLDVARRIVAAAGELLRPGGHLLVEVGADQDHLLAPALAAAGLSGAERWYDDDGDLRGLATRRRALKDMTR